MTFAELKQSIIGKAVVLSNDFNGLTSRWTIEEIKRSEDGYLITAFDNERQALILEATPVRLHTMTRKDYSRKFKAPDGGTTTITLSIR